MDRRPYIARLPGAKRLVVAVLVMAGAIVSACDDTPSGAPGPRGKHSLPALAHDMGDQAELSRALEGLRNDHHFQRGNALFLLHRRGWAKSIGERDLNQLRRIIEVDPERNRALALALLAHHSFEDIFPTAASLVARSRNPGLCTRLKNDLRSLADRHLDYLRKASLRSYTPKVQALALEMLKGKGPAHRPVAAEKP